MKRIALIVATALVAAFVWGCSAPLDNRIESFVEKTEAKCESYSQEDWDKSLKQYEALVNEYQTNIDSYTQEQKEKINKAIGRYSGILVKQGVNAAGKAVKDAIDGASSFINGVKESLGTEN